MPRPGTAVHLQEVPHREQMNGSPAPGIPPCAHELRVVRWTRSGSKEECPRSRECRDQATQADRQDIFPKERPNVRKKGEVSERFLRPVRRPVPAGSGRYSGQFLPTERSVPKDGVRNPRGSAERLRGAAVSFQMTTASSNEGLAQNPVQRGRSAEGACNRTPEHDARTVDLDGSTNPHERGRCPRNGGSLRNNGTSDILPRRYVQMSLG